MSCERARLSIALAWARAVLGGGGACRHRPFYERRDSVVAKVTHMGRHFVCFCSALQPWDLVCPSPPSPSFLSSPETGRDSGRASRRALSPARRAAGLFQSDRLTSS